MRKLCVFILLFFINITNVYCQNELPKTGPPDFETQKGILALTIFLFGFFITLSFIHFLIYLFYRVHKTNLFYSIFVLFFGLLFGTSFLYIGNTNQENQDFYSNVFLLPLIPCFFVSLMTFIYSLFYIKTPKLVWISVIVLIVFLVLYYLAIFPLIIYLIIPFTIIMSLIEVVKAIIKKKKGALIALAILLFLFTSIVIVVGITLNTGITLQGNNIVFIILIILFIPLMMSIYLAKDFAQVNKNLSKKLVEVEELSVKTIEQEKEKQKILETQKEVLEVQVKERTSEIVHQKGVIEEKNKDIIDSINYAKRIQHSLMPDDELKQKLFPNSFIYFQPKDIVSGDFYWFTEKNGYRIIAAADCTGHGVPGALMSMLGMNFLHQIVNENGIVEPALILQQLSIEIRKALKQDNKEASVDGMDIAIITVLDKQIQYAGANRSLLKITNGELSEIKSDKVSIGGHHSKMNGKFTNHTFLANENEILYIFSDGYADQFGGTTGKKMMTKNFKKLLLQICNESVEKQKNIIGKTHLDWKGTFEQTDDLLVIGIKL